MPNTVEETLAELLSGTAAALDIPPELHAAAVARYEAVADWLAAPDVSGDDGGWDIYPQGSFSLGIVVQPVTRRDEYDIDLVCRVNIRKDSLTQADLKRKVGAPLVEYVEVHEGEPEAPGSCKEGRRCWTLEYPKYGFHMDTLPSIPDPEGSSTSILLPDRDLRYWQHSDPIAYANWFRSQMEQELLRKRAALARELRASIEDVPEWKVKTVLQRGVQVLKRHRDVFFANDLEDRPPSIILTTLAARAYQGEKSLYAAIIEAVQEMPRFIENRNGVWWVANPVHSQENFADKWNEHPQRRQKFMRWLSQVEQDLTEAGETKGLDRVVARLSKSFGDNPVVEAAKRFAEGLKDQRQAGRLTMATGTGLLGATGAVKVSDHGFYGAPTKPTPS